MVRTCWGFPMLASLGSLVWLVLLLLCLAWYYWGDFVGFCLLSSGFSAFWTRVLWGPMPFGGLTSEAFVIGLGLYWFGVFVREWSLPFVCKGFFVIRVSCCPLVILFGVSPAQSLSFVSIIPVCLCFSMARCWGLFGFSVLVFSDSYFVFLLWREIVFQFSTFVVIESMSWVGLLLEQFSLKVSFFLCVHAARLWPRRP